MPVPAALELVTTMVNSAVCPALIVPTVPPSGVFTIDKLGFWQMMLPVSVTTGSLPELTDARFGIDVHAAKLVAALNTTVFDAPLVMSPKLQLSTCGLVPLIAQPVTPGVSAQLTPPPSGSVSVSVTFFAVPAPP